MIEMVCAFICLIGFVGGLAYLLWPGRGGARKMADTTETKETTTTAEAVNNETTSAAGGAGGSEQKPEGQAAPDQVAAWREAYVSQVKGQPGVIPELINGETLEAIQASVTASKAAFERVAEAVKASLPTAGAAAADGAATQVTPAPAAGGGPRLDSGPKIPANASGVELLRIAVEQSQIGKPNR